MMEAFLAPRDKGTHYLKIILIILRVKMTPAPAAARKQKINYTCINAQTKQCKNASPMQPHNFKLNWSKKALQPQSTLQSPN
jgi:hypothetical protein